MLTPLRHRDFALLWTGMTVSLVGDGLFYVAIAWQVYTLSNTPTALSLVGVAQTVPLLVFVLLGGVLSDRFDRRRLMIATDVVRGVSVAAIGLLSVTGTLELWHLFALAGLYGAGQAFFWPAFGAITPQIVPRDELVQANSLAQLVRPATMMFIGPALGGALIAAFGAGTAFLADAGSFAFSSAMLLLMQARPLARDGDGEQSVLRELREGFRFVRAETWLWGTLLMAAVTLLLTWGPWEVLIPYIVKNELGGSARDLGLVFGAGGLGSVVASLVLAQRGLPSRFVTFMYATWAIGAGLMGIYAVATASWQVMLAGAAMNGLFTAGIIVWLTMMQRLVPAELLGRVKSFDWLVSSSLVPVSLAITGPIARVLGAGQTMLWAGLVGAAGTVVFLFLPRMRDPERDGRLRTEPYVEAA